MAARKTTTVISPSGKRIPFSVSKAGRDEWRGKNKDRLKAISKRYRVNRKAKGEEKHKAYMRSWRENKKSDPVYLEKRKAYLKSWRSKNRELINRKDWDRTLARLDNDPSFALSRKLRTQLAMSLGGGFSDALLSVIIGCDIDEFRKIIQSKFKAGMSFENRSRWQIDHVFPLSCCGKDSEDVVKSFNNKNLRPEWSRDNLSKRDRVTTDGVHTALLCGIQKIHLRWVGQISAEALERAKYLGFSVFLKGVQIV